MHVTEPEEQLKRLAGAVNGKARWVIVTDYFGGHVRLSTLGMMLLNSGVADGEMDCGIAEVFLIDRQQLSRLSFLTVPKRLLSRRKLATLLAAAGIPAKKPNAGQDLIAVCGPDGAEVLMRILDQVRRGKVTLVRPGEN